MIKIKRVSVRCKLRRTEQINAGFVKLRQDSQKLNRLAEAKANFVRTKVDFIKLKQAS